MGRWARVAGRRDAGRPPRGDDRTGSRSRDRRSALRAGDRRARLGHRPWRAVQRAVGDRGAADRADARAAAPPSDLRPGRVSAAPGRARAPRRRRDVADAAAGCGGRHDHRARAAAAAPVRRGRRSDRRDVPGLVSARGGDLAVRRRPLRPARTPRAGPRPGSSAPGSRCCASHCPPRRCRWRL